MRDALARCRATFARVAEPLALAAGSSDPVRDGKLLVSLVNGVLLDQLTVPEERFATQVAPVAVCKILAAIAALRTAVAPSTDDAYGLGRRADPAAADQPPAAGWAG